MKLADRKDYIHRNLAAINDVPGLRGKQAQRLRKLIADRLVAVPQDAGLSTGRQLDSELERNVPILKTAVALAVKKHYAREIGPADFELRVERINETDWRAKLTWASGLGSTRLTHIRQSLTASSG